jgi:DNA-binding transcriptional regulator YiaG
MTPAEIKDLRERLGLSQRELGIGLGMRTDPARAIRGWEAGSRNGRPDAPAPPTIMAMRYLEAIVHAMDDLDEGEPHRARNRLSAALPVTLRERV